jgi:hypothetical protein
MVQYHDPDERTSDTDDRVPGTPTTSGGVWGQVVLLVLWMAVIVLLAVYARGSG